MLQLNAQVPGHLSQLASKLNFTLIYISTSERIIIAGYISHKLTSHTDYVFDGTSPPYAPGATPHPLNVYGESKRSGEEEVLAHGGIVLRLPILYVDL